MLGTYALPTPHLLPEMKIAQAVRITVQGGFGYSLSPEARRAHFMEQKYLACRAGSTILLYGDRPQSLIFQLDERRRTAFSPDSWLPIALVSTPQGADVILDYITTLYWPDQSKQPPAYLHLDSWLHPSEAPVKAKWGETPLVVHVKKRKEFPGFSHVSVYTDDNLHALVVKVSVSNPESYRVSVKRTSETDVKIPYWSVHRRMTIKGSQ